ncbi:MAG TPA: GNAT family N-acetyltransferase [Burkholderiaceae bacterium]|nr:GNAT family N-acetyltransferase [Burkholderiaceae bacterium]
MATSIQELQGARVRLRAWVPGDREPFAELNADPVTMEFFPAALSRSESDAMIDRLQARLEEHGWGLWCLDVGGQCAGFVGLAVPTFDAHFTPCVEIGWRLDKAFWGRGYATEGARLALRFGFESLLLPEVVSFTAVSNWRSRRVMQRLGMTHRPEEDFEHPRLPEGHTLRRHVLYRMPAVNLK